MLVIITIPAYNEEKTIGNIIKEIRGVMDKQKYKYIISLVDDGSTDNTSKIAKNAGAIVYSHTINCGLAETFRTEIKRALELKGDIIIHIDADGQYLPQDIPRLISEIEKGYDLVLGDRFNGGIEKMPLIKKLGNKLFSIIISRIIKYKIRDCQTGFRAFTKEFAKSIEIKSNHTYTQEQIIRGVKQRFKIKEIPTKFLKREDGKSRLISNPFEYAIKAMINIMRVYRDFEPLKFFGIIGGIFMLIGFIIGVLLTINFIVTGKVGHIPSTILSVLLLIFGLQIWLFGFLADMNKNK